MDGLYLSRDSNQVPSVYDYSLIGTPSFSVWAVLQAAKLTIKN